MKSYEFLLIISAIYLAPNMSPRSRDIWGAISFIAALVMWAAYMSEGARHL